jgi:hypothetical protein
VDASESRLFEDGLARLPRWILLLAAAGTLLSFVFSGLQFAGGFLIGSLAAWFNLRVVERAVNRIARLAGDAAAEPKKKPGKRTGFRVFLQFTGLVMGGIVILKVSGFSLAAAFWGFLVCPAAVLLELIFEFVKYDHS